MHEYYQHIFQDEAQVDVMVVAGSLAQKRVAVNWGNSHPNIEVGVSYDFDPPYELARIGHLPKCVIIMPEDHGVDPMNPPKFHEGLSLARELCGISVRERCPIAIIGSSELVEKPGAADLFRGSLPGDFNEQQMDQVIESILHYNYT